jgi:hypothetical protein
VVLTCNCSMRRLAPALLIIALRAFPIDIRIYSEHAPAREVLSPPVVRNSHGSFRVVVTAPPGTLYFMAVQTNPADVLRVKLYRQPARRKDYLIEERNIGFLAGVTPAGLDSSAETSTVYLLDLWVPADARQGPVRVEALVKTADWRVAPMEVRILPLTAPALPACLGPLDKHVDAYETLVSGLRGDPPLCLPLLTGFGSVLARNSVEDAALAQTLPPVARQTLHRAILTSLVEHRWSYIAPDPGDLYFSIRQLLYREAVRAATDRAIPEMLKRVPDSR